MKNMKKIMDVTKIEEEIMKHPERFQRLEIKDGIYCWNPSYISSMIRYDLYTPNIIIRGWNNLPLVNKVFVVSFRIRYKNQKTDIKYNEIIRRNPFYKREEKMKAMKGED